MEAKYEQVASPHLSLKLTPDGWVHIELRRYDGGVLTAMTLDEACAQRLASDILKLTSAKSGWWGRLMPGDITADGDDGDDRPLFQESTPTAPATSRELVTTSGS